MRLEKIHFERAVGVELTLEFLKSRVSKNVDIRDFFVALMVEKGYRLDAISDYLKKDRVSLYASCDRFNKRYKSDASYKSQFDKIKERHINQLPFEEEFEEQVPERDFNSEIQATINELRNECQIIVDDNFLTSRVKIVKNERCIVVKILCDKHGSKLVSKTTGLKIPCIAQHLREFDIRHRMSVEFRSLYNEIKI